MDNWADDTDPRVRRSILVSLGETAEDKIDFKETLTLETNKMAIVRDFLKSMNLNPEEVLSKEAQSMPHRTVIDYSHQLSEQEQIGAMLRALMQKLKKDIIAETQEISQKTV